MKNQRRLLYRRITCLFFALFCSICTCFSQDESVLIGEDGSSSRGFPYQTSFNYSTVQMIYRPNEIGRAGTITSLAFEVHENNGTTRANNQSVKIYMSHTTKSNFETNWSLPSSSLTLVYSGELTLGTNSGLETISLTNSFEYNGLQNLVIVVCRSSSTTTSSPVYYKNKTIDSTDRRTRYISSNTDSDYADITSERCQATSYSREYYLPTIQLTFDSSTTSYPYWEYPSALHSFPFEGGSGTESDPYLIATAQQLANLAFAVNDGKSGYVMTAFKGECKYYKLIADIDLRNKLWTPIGTYRSNSTYFFYGYFVGVFDGDGHKIKGLNVKRNSDFCGLFGSVGMGRAEDKTTIKNLIIEGGSVVGSYVNGSYAGAFAGFAVSASFIGCENRGCSVSITTMGSAGGIVGYVSDPLPGIRHIIAFNSGSVSTSGTAYTSGICSTVSDDVLLSNCLNVGAVSGPHANALCNNEASDAKFSFFLKGSCESSAVNATELSDIPAQGGAPEGQVFSVTEELLNSGYIANLLHNYGQNSYGYWNQQVDVDPYPVIYGSPYQVYQTNTKCCNGSTDILVGYSNTNDSGVSLINDLEHHASVAATCTNSGSIEYWSCKQCGRLYSDASATTQLTSNSIQIPATGHSYNLSGKCTVCGNQLTFDSNGFSDLGNYYQEPILSNGYYQIANAGNLYWFASQVNSGSNRGIKGKLTADIVVNNASSG